MLLWRGNLSDNFPSRNVSAGSPGIPCGIFVPNCSVPGGNAVAGNPKSRSSIANGNRPRDGVSQAGAEFTAAQDIPSPQFTCPVQSSSSNKQKSNSSYTPTTPRAEKRQEHAPYIVSRQVHKRTHRTKVPQDCIKAVYAEFFGTDLEKSFRFHYAGRPGRRRSFQRIWRQRYGALTSLNRVNSVSI